MEKNEKLEYISLEEMFSDYNEKRQDPDFLTHIANYKISDAATAKKHLLENVDTVEKAIEVLSAIDATLSMSQLEELGDLLADKYSWSEFRVGGIKDYILEEFAEISNSLISIVSFILDSEIISSEDFILIDELSAL